MCYRILKKPNAAIVKDSIERYHLGFTWWISFAVGATVFLVGALYLVLLVLNHAAQGTSYEEISNKVYYSFSEASSRNPAIIIPIITGVGFMGAWVFTMLRDCFHAKQVAYHIEGTAEITRLDIDKNEKTMKKLEKMTEFIEKILILRPEELQTVFGLLLGDISEDPDTNISIVYQDLYIKEAKAFKIVGRGPIVERRTRKKND